MSLAPSQPQRARAFPPRKLPAASTAVSAGPVGRSPAGPAGATGTTAAKSLSSVAHSARSAAVRSISGVASWRRRRGRSAGPASSWKLAGASFSAASTSAAKASGASKTTTPLINCRLACAGVKRGRSHAASACCCCRNCSKTLSNSWPPVSGVPFSCQRPYPSAGMLSVPPCGTSSSSVIPWGRTTTASSGAAPSSSTRLPSSSESVLLSAAKAVRTAANCAARAASAKGAARKK